MSLIHRIIQVLHIIERNITGDGFTYFSVVQNTFYLAVTLNGNFLLVLAEDLDKTHDEIVFQIAGRDIFPFPIYKITQLIRPEKPSGPKKPSGQ